MTTKTAFIRWDSRPVRYTMTALGRDGCLLGRAELDHRPTEAEVSAYRALFPQEQREWTTVEVGVALP